MQIHIVTGISHHLRKGSTFHLGSKRLILYGMRNPSDSGTISELPALKRRLDILISGTARKIQLTYVYGHRQSDFARKISINRHSKSLSLLANATYL